LKNLVSVNEVAKQQRRRAKDCDQPDAE